MEQLLEEIIQKDNEQFKQLLFEKLRSITQNAVILDVLNNIEHENVDVQKDFDSSKYIKTELYNIGGKEYMIDTNNGIVFGGKRADIVEILSQDELKKMKES